jgi:3'-5' exoribonuclease
MTRRAIDTLTDGDAVDEVYLVADKHLRANRNGNLYLQLHLRDRTGTLEGRMWNAGEQLFKSFEVGDFLTVKGKVQLFQGSLQIIINTVEKADANKVELTEYLPHTEHDISKLLERLRQAVRKFSNPHLRGLAEAFLMDDDFMRAFCRVPAGVRVHHAYVGGLLEHVVSMIDVAERIAPLYAGLDRDLLVIGVLLHDAGKTRELSCGRIFGYTDEGQLIGHLAIGVEMVNEKIPQVVELTGEPFPRELLFRIKHLILSHHGTLEFGSPRVPMTPEAVALHAIDTLDTKIHIVLRDLREDRNPGTAWTAFNPALQRRVFKGGGDGGAVAGGGDDYM